MQKLTSIIKEFVIFINTTLVPLLFAIAFIVFLWGIFKYFIQGADNPEKRDTGRQFVVYGLVGFFIMISIWGLVNVLVGTFNFDSNGRPCLPTFGKDNNCSGGSSGGSNSTNLTKPENLVPADFLTGEGQPEYKSNENDAEELQPGNLHGVY